MSVIDQLKADFLPRLNDLKSVKVTLAGSGDEMEIFFRPVANIKQTDKYLPLMQQNKIEGYVELVLNRALDETGRRIFAPKDKQTLMSDIDPEWLTDVGNAILGVDEDEAERIEKESEKAAKKSD